MTDATPEGWQPDLHTLRWLAGRTDLDRVASTVRSDLSARRTEAEASEDAYWRVLAEAALEAIIWPAARELRTAEDEPTG
ncbi:hypothetical protein ACFQ05_12640 [Amycolatopsis umgeniensis]|uniref:Uncharacterized protein n=1 Tax=Amycolatopsis umgeniensis TaxID=336628 RepID=A0A841AYY6_9PSEU|nr:hypothetical protein [Amycolatopsis umgeniensis]MBB5854149.1 hypothetical protein [Amycolatopsis umgeniensis]